MRVNARSNRQSIAFRSLESTTSVSAANRTPLPLERVRPPQSGAVAAKADGARTLGRNGLLRQEVPSFWRPGKYTFDAWAMSSYKEGLSQKLVDANRHAEWATHNTAHLSRVYPRGRRLDSSNYNPAPLAGGRADDGA